MNRAPQHGIDLRDEAEYRRIKPAIERAKERESRAGEFGMFLPEGRYPAGRFEVEITSCDLNAITGDQWMQLRALAAEWDELLELGSRRRKNGRGCRWLRCSDERAERAKRILNLRRVMQKEHPDKGGDDVERFRAPIAELESLRAQAPA